jgi:hypothetical protein
MPPDRPPIPAAPAGNQPPPHQRPCRRLVQLLDVLGGPDYQVTYPNGDHTAYVTAVIVGTTTLPAVGVAQTLHTSMGVTGQPPATLPRPPRPMARLLPHRPEAIPSPITPS